MLIEAEDDDRKDGGGKGETVERVSSRPGKCWADEDLIHEP